MSAHAPHPADAVVRPSWQATDLSDHLAELGVNALLLGAVRQGAVAVDARAVLSDRPTAAGPAVA